MSTQVKLGSYDIAVDPRGFRVERPRENPSLVVRPLLSFTITEEGRAAIPLMVQRLTPLGTDGAEFQAQFQNRIAIVGTIKAIGDGLDFQLTVQNSGPEAKVRIAAVWTMTGEAEPIWLVPGFFYNDNKPPGCTRMYPSFSEISRDPRRMTSSYWAIRSDRTALPLACAWTFGCFAWVATTGVFGKDAAHPRGVGMTGLYFGAEDGQPALAAEFPYREAPAKFSFCHEDKTEPEDTYLGFSERSSFQASFRVGFGAPELKAYGRIMRQLYSAGLEANPPKAKMPPDVAETIAHGGLLRWHYDGRQAAIYESATFDRHFSKKGSYLERPHMHVGWLSGALPAFTLLWAGRESNHPESITAGTAVLNKFTSQLAPAGTIFPVWTEEHGWSSSFGPDEGSAHSRTVAEAVLFILRALALEMAFNTPHPQWYEAASASLTYAMGAQREDGAFPAYYDLTTGRPTSYDGCGGLPWLAAIAAAAGLFQLKHYRDIARKAGDYYANFVNRGLVYGCVEDQPLVPTSDDCHWALISYMLLYELDRDVRWLELARKSADLALTWRLTYNIQFSENTVLGKYDFRTRGGDISSVATPTLGCNGLISYREMMKLSAYTGDEYYAQRADDARLFATQLVAREDGDLNARAGMVASQVFFTDWYQPKGVVLSLSQAMSASLVKHAELVRRNLKITSRAAEAAKTSDLEKEMNKEKHTYADAARDDAFVASSDAIPARAALFGDANPTIRTSGVNRLPAFSGPSGLAGTNVIGHAADGLDIPTAGVPRGRNESRGGSSEDVSRMLTGAMGSMLGLSQPTPRGRSNRGLSSDAVPIPPIVGPTPIPFASGEPQNPLRGGDPQQPQTGEDVEIKYKIF